VHAVLPATGEGKKKGNPFVGEKKRRVGADIIKEINIQRENRTPVRGMGENVREGEKGEKNITIEGTNALKREGDGQGGLKEVILNIRGPSGSQKTKERDCKHLGKKMSRISRGARPISEKKMERKGRKDRIP